MKIKQKFTVAEVKKKTMAPLFRDLRVDDVIEISTSIITLPYSGRGYDFTVKNTLTGDSRNLTSGRLRMVLGNFKLQEME